MTLDEAYVVLGVANDTPPKQVRLAWIGKARTAHPDHGGTATEFNRIDVAYNLVKTFQFEEKCTACHGRGRVLVVNGFQSVPLTCGHCAGTGLRWSDEKK